MAREAENCPVSSLTDALDLATAVAALAELPEVDRRARLHALADALRGLPLAERAALAARLFGQ